MKSIPVQSDDLPSIVLIVDADETTRAMCCAQFESAGLWVATSINPIEAIEAVRELRPNLVVTTTFEGVDFDLVGALKADPMTKRIPVILLTERANDKGTDAQLADLCLRKPVVNRLLVENGQQLIVQSRTVGGGPVSGPTHQLVLTSPQTVKRNSQQTTRSCPGCGGVLEWIERGRLHGVEYDYYRWCEAGCGLYCYECRAETWVKLV